MILMLLLCFVSTGVKADTNTQSPWTFWYWMYGAVSKDGIKADLKCMKDIGLGGCYLMPIRGTNDKGAPPSKSSPRGKMGRSTVAPFLGDG